MTPEQILQLRAAIANMQRSQGGITGAAARRWNAVGGWADKVYNYGKQGIQAGFPNRRTTKVRQAEINKAAAIEKERIRAAEAARRSQYIDKSQYRQRGATQPGTARSSRTFRGGSGAPYHMNIHEHFMGGPRGKYRRKWPRAQTEVYNPPGMITV